MQICPCTVSRTSDRLDTANPYAVIGQKIGWSRRRRDEPDPHRYRTNSRRRNELAPPNAARSISGTPFASGNRDSLPRAIPSTGQERSVRCSNSTSGEASPSTRPRHSCRCRGGPSTTASARASCRRSAPSAGRSACWCLRSTKTGSQTWTGIQFDSTPGDETRRSRNGRFGKGARHGVASERRMGVPSVLLLCPQRPVWAQARLPESLRKHVESKSAQTVDVIVHGSPDEVRAHRRAPRAAHQEELSESAVLRGERRRHRGAGRRCRSSVARRRGRRRSCR